MPTHSHVFSFASLNDGKDTNEHITIFNPVIKLPPTIHNARVALVSATIWNTVPNIAAPNNVITYLMRNKPNDVSDTTYKTIELVIPPGLYSMQLLNETLERLHLDQELDPLLFFLLEDLPTDRLMFSTKSTNYKDQIILLNKSGTPSNLLGLPADPNFTLTIKWENQELAPNTAFFNQQNWFVLKNSLASPGLLQDGRSGQILDKVYLTEGANTMLVYTPGYPIFVDASDLHNFSHIQSVRGAWYQDDAETTAYTGNPWQYTVELKYDY